MNLTHIKVGDLIAIPAYNRSFGSTPHVGHEIYRVIKRTATQAEAVKNELGGSGIRIRVADGKVIGEDYIRAVEATTELIAQHKTQADIRRRHIESECKLEDLVLALTRRKLTTDQLEALAASWDQIKAIGPKEAA